MEFITFVAQADAAIDELGDKNVVVYGGGNIFGGEEEKETSSTVEHELRTLFSKYGSMEKNAQENIQNYLND
jgi:hypothetical protein